MSKDTPIYEVELTKPLVSGEIFLNKDVRVILSRCSEEMIQLLRQSHEHDSSLLKCSKAALTFLFHFDGLNLAKEEAKFRMEYYGEK